MSCKPEELLIYLVARHLTECRHVCVGVSSPIPGSAAQLARVWSGRRMVVNLLGDQRHNSFNSGGQELFDLAAQGRIDAFFLGGGQIDGQANINLVGTGGDYPQMSVRWPGSFGSAYLYYLVPNVVLFREEHTPRVLVPKVDFISAPGLSPPEHHRVGGPTCLITGKAEFSFDRDKGRFRLESIHPGYSLADIEESTGFDFDRPASVPESDMPDTATLAQIRGEVADNIRSLYPVFADKVFA